MVKNAAEGKRQDISKFCKVCGIVLVTEKDKRRKMCKKHHRLERKRWRSQSGGRTTKRARRYGG